MSWSVMRPVKEWCLIVSGVVPFIPGSLKSGCVGASSAPARGRCCLEHGWELHRGAVRDLCRSIRPRSNCLHGSRRLGLLLSVLPFGSGTTPVRRRSLLRDCCCPQGADLQGEAFAPSRRSALSASLIGVSTTVIE